MVPPAMPSLFHTFAPTYNAAAAARVLARGF